MDVSETQLGGATDFSQIATTQLAASESGRAVRYASFVIGRAIRSSGGCDNILRERIVRAVRVIETAQSTETAVICKRPTDAIFRLAARVVRGLYRTRLPFLSDGSRRN